MSRFFVRTLITFCIIASLSDISFAQTLPDSIPLRVVVIRHGEKPQKGLNLSCQGYNRSIELPKTLIAQFGVPTYTYVPFIKNGKSANALRMFQTVIPLAVKYDLQINTVFGENDSTEIASDVLKKRGTVLIVWNSTDIPSIVRNLGVKGKIPKWKDTDFDSIWIINYTKTPEGLLSPVFATSKEGITPSPLCKDPE